MNSETIDFSKHAEVNYIAQLLHDNGFTLIIPDNEKPTSFDTYFYFSKDNNIGYAQKGDFGGIRFSTVNKPCKECGTGFGLQNWDEAIYEPTVKDAEKAFNGVGIDVTAHIPHAVRASVRLPLPGGLIASPCPLRPKTSAFSAAMLFHKSCRHRGFVAKTISINADLPDIFPLMPATMPNELPYSNHHAPPNFANAARSAALLMSRSK